MIRIFIPLLIVLIASCVSCTSVQGTLKATAGPLELQLNFIPGYPQPHRVEEEEPTEGEEEEDELLLSLLDQLIWEETKTVKKTPEQEVHKLVCYKVIPTEYTVVYVEGQCICLKVLQGIRAKSRNKESVISGQ